MDFEEILEQEAIRAAKRIVKQLIENRSAFPYCDEALRIELPSLEERFFNFDHYKNFTKFERLLVSYRVNGLANGGLAAGGVCLAGTSLLSVCHTQNRVARYCYMLSFFCSSTATVAGTLKVFDSGGCGIWRIAICGDTFGGSFLYLGKKAQRMGEAIENKKKSGFNPFKKSSIVRRPKTSHLKGYKNMSFVPVWSSDMRFDEIINAIPFQKITLVGGYILTIYVYGKYLIVIYRYCQKLMSKHIASKEINYSKVIRKQTIFLINVFHYQKSTHRIYRFVLSNIKN